MSRALLLWLALSVVVLAAVLFIVRDASRGDVGLDLDAGHANSQASTFELAGAATTGGEQRAVERAHPPSPADVASLFPRDTMIWREPKRFQSGVIEVRVVHDEDGTPFDGVRVSLTPALLDAVRPAKGTTDAQGVAVFEGLTDTYWDVLAEAEGCVAMRGGAPIQPEHPNASVEVRLAMQRDVLVRLVDAAGRDLSAADIGLAAEDAGNLALVLGASCSIPGERYVLTGAPAHRSRSASSAAAPFRWQLEIRGRGTACVHVLLGDVVLAAEPLDPRASEALVRIDPAVIRGAVTPIGVRVVTTRGEVPVEGARVRFEGPRRKVVDRLTDKEGRASFDGLVVGSLTLRVAAEGFAPASVSVQRPVEGEVLVRLEVARSIAGVVLDQDGRPMARAVVGIYRPNPAGVSRTVAPSELAITELDGTFRFVNVHGGEYVVGVGGQSADGRRVLPERDARAIDAAYAECSEGDVLGLVLYGYRPVNPTTGPDWDPPPFPR